MTPKCLPPPYRLITDKIIPLVKEWQARPLDNLYCIVWLDAMYYKVKEEGRIVTRCGYNILGITTEGKKEVLGMYVSHSEGAHFWLSVHTDLQNRGVEDILIACIDNLKGFAEAIVTVFPKTDVQSCIVHQIRGSLRYVGTRDQKESMRDLKPVYQAVNKERVEVNLEKLAENGVRNTVSSLAPGKRPGRSSLPILNTRRRSES